MTTQTITDADLDRMQNLIHELIQAGRMDEAESMVRALMALQQLLYPELMPGLPEDDPELIEMLEEAERDIRAGNVIPHEQVLPKLRALADG
jgi:signal transduction histidine kinase